MNYFLDAHFSSDDLRPWRELLPTDVKFLVANLFGDSFVCSPDGSIHMLNIGRCEVRRVADSEAEFGSRILLDPEGWLLGRLVDACVAEGKLLSSGHCYGFATLPIFRTGSYTPSNVFMAPFRECLRQAGDVFTKVLGVAGGAPSEIAPRGAAMGFRDIRESAAVAEADSSDQRGIIAKVLGLRG